MTSRTPTVMQVERRAPQATSAGSAECAEAAEIMQLRLNFLVQLNSVALYEGLAALERDESHRCAYSQSAAAGRESAESWAARLRSAGAPVPRIRIPRHIRLIAKLVRYLSGGFAIPIFTRTPSANGTASEPQ